MACVFFPAPGKPQWCGTGLNRTLACGPLEKAAATGFEIFLETQNIRPPLGPSASGCVFSQDSPGDVHVY